MQTRSGKRNGKRSRHGLVKNFPGTGRGDLIVLIASKADDARETNEVGDATGCAPMGETPLPVEEIRTNHGPTLQVLHPCLHHLGGPLQALDHGSPKATSYNVTLHYQFHVTTTPSSFSSCIDQVVLTRQTVTQSCRQAGNEPPSPVILADIEDSAACLRVLDIIYRWRIFCDWGYSVTGGIFCWARF